MTRVAWGWPLACCAMLMACDNGAATAEPAATAAPGSAPVAPAEGFIMPPAVPHDSNPLGLPPKPVPTLKNGQRIFAVPPEMLQTAEPGKALAMLAATSQGADGEDMLVRVGHGEIYAIHPGYVIVPTLARFNRGAEVIANYRGKLHHGVVKGLSRDRIVVRFTDLGFKPADQKIASDRLGVLGAGLVPGAYAAHRSATEYRLVQLVSRAGDKWLVLEHGGQARLIAADQLRRLPERRFKPKVGSTVLVSWRGSMVRGQVRSLDRPGLYTVKRPRTGGAVMVGLSQMMATD